MEEERLFSAGRQRQRERERKRERKKPQLEKIGSGGGAKDVRLGGNASNLQAKREEIRLDRRGGGGDGGGVRRRRRE